MIQYLTEMLSYPFMVRALVGGVLLSLCAALLGVSLVLKRYSMIGDGLSHVGFGALAVASALHLAPLAVAIPVVIAAAFWLLKLSQSGKMRGDAATAVFSTGALAIGVMVVSMSTGMNADLNSYLFGSILAMGKEDIQLSVIVSVLILIIYIFCYDKIFAVTFDEDFAKATGTRTDLFNTLLAVLTAIVVVLGMRMMGALLISSLIVFPALTSMRLFKSYKHVLISSVVLAVLSFMAGISISFVYATPTGASIVVVDVILFTAASVLAWIRGR
ncbi:MAG: metal ABC transporter permease [Lachnospiraceae bacterium]|nr:metal ABC transporter permease [Lachnospiraceae bacterium]